MAAKVNVSVFDMEQRNKKICDKLFFIEIQ